MSISSVIKNTCMECLSAANGKGGFDCLSRLCAFYLAMPFRGKEIPSSFVGESGSSKEEKLKMKAFLIKFPTRIGTLDDIKKFCRDCGCGASEPCNNDKCPVYVYSPYNPKPHKVRTLSPEIIEKGKEALRKYRERKANN